MCLHRSFNTNNGSSSPAASSSEEEEEVKALSNEELRSVKLRNQNMRQMIYKEVRELMSFVTDFNFIRNFSIKK